jgi:hypothetical protein
MRRLPDGGPGFPKLSLAFIHGGGLHSLASVVTEGLIDRIARKTGRT